MSTDALMDELQPVVSENKKVDSEETSKHFTISA